MIVAVVLGNRLNDDGSITDKMRCRLDLALEIHKTLLPCKMVLSGGVANPLAGKSEAQAMFDILVRAGVPQNVLIREEKSLTTKQNAFYSVPIVAQCGADVLLLCTSPEHMHRKYLNPKRLFARMLKGYPDIRLETCCTLEEVQKLKGKN